MRGVLDNIQVGINCLPYAIQETNTTLQGTIIVMRQSVIPSH
jgi:hypothetical protein